MSSANRTTSRVYDALAVAPRGRFIKGRSADLDVMRAVAALLVLANHAVLIGGSPYAETDRSVPALLYHGSGALGGIALLRTQWLSHRRPVPSWAHGRRFDP